MRKTTVVCALVVAAAFAAVPVLAQQNATRVRGTIVSLNGNVLAVEASGENRKITLAGGLRVVWLVKSDLSHVKPGTFIGSAATTQPDGTLRAVEVHIFPESMRGTGEGSRPYDLGPQSSMTNGTVDTSEEVESVGGNVLTVKYKDGEKKIIVTKSTPVVLYEPTDAKALMPGAHVYIIATRESDGSLSTNRVNVGKDGLVPPM